MKNHRHSIIVFFLACAYALSSTWLGVNFYDEGIIVTGGMRVLHGDIPHRDFASLYPYGSYYVSATIQFIFGSGLLSFRFFAACIFAGLCSLSYLFSIRMGLSSFYGTLSSLTICLWCGGASVSVRAVFIALFCTLLSLYVLTGNHKHKKLISLALLLFASTIRWDIALYGSIAWSVFVATDNRFQWKKFVLCFFAICFATFIFPLLTVWAIGGATTTIKAIEQTIVFPVMEFPSVRGLSFPLFYPRWNGESRADVMLASLALWAMLIYIATSIVQFFINKSTFDSPRQRLMLTLVVLMAGLMNQARVRSDFEHCIPALFPFIILMFYSVSNQHIQKKYIIVMTVLLLCLPGALKGKQWIQSFSYAPFTAKWGRGIYSENSANYDSLVTSIQNMTFPEDHIFICPEQGETNQSSDLLLYYAAGRLPASYFYEFHPGITDRSDIQQHIINDCIDNNCRLIVRQQLSSNQSAKENNAQISDTLDTFIAKHYYRVRTIHGYTLMKPIAR